MKCNKSATKTRRNAAFEVKIKKYFISRAKNLMRGTRSAPGGDSSEGSTHSLKAKKRNGHLVERTEVCYNIFCNAPSPSGKAGDFDSPIVGSTPAGATVEKPARFAAFGQIVRVLFVSGCGAEVCKTGLEGRQGCACALFSWVCKAADCSRVMSAPLACISRSGSAVPTTSPCLLQLWKYDRLNRQIHLDRRCVL